ncbi:hypothetical protein C922_03476 [Plasmodium inui San Antonio 1]|uniref:Uncharacterized protein n=1 Tax=Plasmodium inui San Antonio 1 TaxID=1237626 RepID=W7AL12_9APIC|nr:hypothetical protein C922_03476 [Plasmodium inui San Antonio 1]EUD66006.1 hypothetical protein C922_03476 [Plasmodium inui San Antonio 1]
MNVVELLEKKHFKAIERSVKRRKLKKYFFALSRFNSLYKGKNKAVGKLWRDISSGGEYLDTINTFAFVNFKYVCEFVKRLGGGSPPEWVDGQDGLHSLEWPYLPPATLGGDIERDPQSVADLFLVQLFRVVRLHASMKRWRNRANTKCEVPLEGASRDEDKPSRDIPHLYDLIFINQKREFEILFSLVHPLVHNIYATNLIADVMMTSTPIDMDKCYMQLLLSVLLHLYKKKKDILFFYFMIYKKWKGVRKNISNRMEIIIEWEAIKLLVRKNKKDIYDFKCLRYFLLNLCDRSAIHRMVNYAFSFLRHLFLSHHPNTWEMDFWTYRKESNYYEFAFFLYLSVEDLCDAELVFFVPPLEKIKKLLQCEQPTCAVDIYLLLHFIDKCDCELSVKLRLILVSLIRCASSPDLFRQHEESFFRAVVEPARAQLLAGSLPDEPPADDPQLDERQLDERQPNEPPPRHRRIAQFISSYLSEKDDLIMRTTKKDSFFNAACIVKYIHVSCYNIVNNRKEYTVKYDNLESDREAPTAHPYEYNLHSDVTSYKNYLSSSVNGDTCRKYATIVSILLHMNLLRLSDIWSFTLTKLVENNVFFQIMNLIRLRRKSSLLCLTISSLLKVRYEAVQEYARAEGGATVSGTVGGSVAGSVVGSVGARLGGGLTGGFFGSLFGSLSGSLPDELVDFLDVDPVCHLRGELRGDLFPPALTKRRALRKDVLEYASNENKLLDILCYLSMNIKKDLLKLPLIILKILFKNVLKYLSKPLHDVKKSISHYFDRMSLRIGAYLFELMHIMSSSIYYQGEVHSIVHYRKKFHLFPVYFILVDVYVKFTEKYSEKNNAVFPSLLSYTFVQGFLFLFDYPRGTSLMGNGLSRRNKVEDALNPFLRRGNESGARGGKKKSQLLSRVCSDYPFTWSGSQRGIPPPSSRLTQMDDMNLMKQSHYSYVDLSQIEGKGKKRGIDSVGKEKSTFNEAYSQHIVSITKRFIEANKNEVSCYFYTLLMFAIARVHTSVCYRYREINYLVILHVLPWKTCLNFCRTDSQLSCFFFQKWYECVHALLPEIILTQFSAGVMGDTEMIDAEEDGDDGYIIPCDVVDTGTVDPLGSYSHLDASNGLYVQIVRAREAMMRLLLSASQDSTVCAPDGAIIMGLESSLLRNCLLVVTFIEVIFLNRGVPLGSASTVEGVDVGSPPLDSPLLRGAVGNGSNSGGDFPSRMCNFAQVMRDLLDEQLCAHYISVFQNPVNFFLRISPKYGQLLVRHNCLDSLVSFLFIKLQSYLSLIPPRLCPEDFLPLNVEDITALQETAVAQCVLSLRGGEADTGYEAGEEADERYKAEEAAGTRYKAEEAADTSYEAREEADERNEVGRRMRPTGPILGDLNFFLKKMDALVKTLSASSLQSLCESAFDTRSAFYLSFYLRPDTFHTVFHYLANNVTAITSDSFNLEDNLNYYKKIYMKKKEPVLNPYNILNKTTFYTQMVVFYLIINANNERMEVESYKKSLCCCFKVCLQGCFKPHMDDFVLSIMPTMLQFYYFFPSFIPDLLGALIEIEMKEENEVLGRELSQFEKRLRRVLEVSYVHSAKGVQRSGGAHSAGK